jgi:hypothetical protein
MCWCHNNDRYYQDDAMRKPIKLALELAPQEYLAPIYLYRQINCRAMHALVMLANSFVPL